MSSDVTADDLAPIIAYYNALVVAGYCNIAATAFLVYESLITLDVESKYFWSGKMTGAKVMFFGNRYIALLYAVLASFALVPTSERCSCVQFAKTTPVIGVLQFIPWAAFSSLRAFVLSRSKLLSIAIFVISLVPVGANLVDLFTVQTAKNMLAFKGGTHDCDIGTAYFVVLFCLNIVHLVFTVNRTLNNGTISVMTTFTTPMTAMLISRFLIQLQVAHQRTVRVDSNDALYLSNGEVEGELSFAARVVGSIGSVINAGQDQDRTDEDGYICNERGRDDEEVVA
ncbi:hypothetical protein C8Q76DRAFT_690767 [Earliella scabrosa]|nr:hypothetical protein C8Q76DRAFT_690767 [Earliella scabrosa]